MEEETMYQRERRVRYQVTEVPFLPYGIGDDNIIFGYERGENIFTAEGVLFDYNDGGLQKISFGGIAARNSNGVMSVYDGGFDWDARYGFVMLHPDGRAVDLKGVFWEPWRMFRGENRFGAAHSLNGEVAVGHSHWVADYDGDEEDYLQASYWSVATGKGCPLKTMESLESTAYHLNRRGVVVGVIGGTVYYWPHGRPAVWEHVEAEPSVLEAPNSAEARFINEKGDVIAGTHLYDGRHKAACVWLRGEFVDLETLGGAESGPLAMNSRGVVVGYSDMHPRGCHAWILREDVADLNEEIPKDSGWELVMATGINDAGLIVGLGVKDGSDKGFILLPI